MEVGGARGVLTVFFDGCARHEMEIDVPPRSAALRAAFSLSRIIDFARKYALKGSAFAPKL